MHFFLLTSVLGLAIVTAAVPHPVKKGTGIAIPIAKRSRMANPGGGTNIKGSQAYFTSIEAMGLHGVDENTGEIHHSTHIQNHAGGAVPLITPEGADEYMYWFGEIFIGTPLQTFNVTFDTGSSDFFLPGPNCTEGGCVGHKQYDPDTSTSEVNLNKDFTTGFGDGGVVKGDQYTDTVTIGGLTVTSQTFGVANYYSDGFSDLSYDGLMGLGFPSKSKLSGNPIFQTLILQDQVTDPVFAVKLAETGSELYLGGVNQGLYTGEFTNIPVVGSDFWHIRLDNVQINEEMFLKTRPTVLIDTGSDAIYVPKSSAETINTGLGGKYEYTEKGVVYYSFLCDEFPTVSLNFSNVLFPISKESLNIGPVPNSVSRCLSGILGVTSGARIWKIGDVFLRNVYTMFDFGSKTPARPAQIGFAVLA